MIHDPDYLKRGSLQARLALLAKMAERWGGHHRAIMDALLQTSPNLCHKDDLIARMYAGREPSNIPKTAAGCLTDAIARLRFRLAPFGWTITHTVGRHGGFKLEEEK